MTVSVIYADTTDGYLESYHAGTYLQARSMAVVTVTDTAGTTAEIGQSYNRDADLAWHCDEGFFQFNTNIGAGATVTACTLSLCSAADHSDTDFTMEARLDDWGTSLTSADAVAGASISGKTLLATYATSGGFTVNTYYTFTDVAFPANVNKTANTRIMVTSDAQRISTDPGTRGTGLEYVDVYTSDSAGTTKDPYITLTYTPAPPGGGTLPIMGV